MKSTLCALMHQLPASRFGRAVLGSLAMAAVAGAPVNNAAPPDAQSSAADQTVTIADFAFAPAELSVPVGATLTWMNAQDDVQHTTTSSDGVWDSGPLLTGDAFPVTFNQTGDIAYICAIHPGMQGLVHVVGDAPAQPAIGAADPTATATLPAANTPAAASATPTPQPTAVQPTSTPQPTVVQPTATPSPTPRRATTPTATPIPY